MKPSPKTAAMTRADTTGPHYRSGAVARMLRMPVATLRIWERRYSVTEPCLSAAGHRRYSAADIRRLALIMQLNDLGHAIGSIAALDMDHLTRVVRTHADAVAARVPGEPSTGAGHPARVARRGRPEATPTQAALAPRRYGDATLRDLAGLSSTIACECPRHIADLLMRLSHFEQYSAECERLDADDDALHAYLQQVAGQAHASFESALERVAIHDGVLPPR